MAFSLRFVAHSEVGRVRKNNQDAGYASPTMLLVTDGMGGAAAGDLASAVASTEAARGDVRARDAEEMLERIAGIIARSNHKLSELIEEDLELDGMGTTFCGAMFNGTQFGLAHIGDSRGYLLRNGSLVQVTHDHSWVQSLIDEGKITPAQAAIHPHRSLILKVLNGQINFEPDLDVIDAQLGDRLMFCSDGLSGLVSDATIRALLGSPDLADGVAQLAAAANEAGGHDNITIVVGEVVEGDDDLDAQPGVLVGSAREIEVPRTGQQARDKGLPSKGQTYPAAPGGADHDDTEKARYAPAEPRRRWPGIVVALLLVALVLGGGAWGVNSYASSRYFVASDEANIAIFNGLPGTFLGIGLNSLKERTDVPVSHLPVFYQGAVESAIPVGSLDAAYTTVSDLRKLAEECQRVREERQQPKPVPSASATGSGSASAPSVSKPGLPPLPMASPTTTPTVSLSASPEPILPTSLGSVTPTATEEANPEDC